MWPTCHGHHFLIIMKSELIKRATEWVHDLVADAILRGWSVADYEDERLGFDIYRNSDFVIGFADDVAERKFSNVKECLTAALGAIRWRDVEAEVDARFDD